MRIHKKMIITTGILVLSLLGTGITQEFSRAVAVIIPTEGNSVSGIVTFTASAEGVQVTANITGLTPGKHGFHIHQYGDISGQDGKTAGGHFNPMKKDHGGPKAGIRHVGDLGNLEADAEGNATLDFVDPHLFLKGKTSIIGRGVIIHAGEDDLSSQPTGAAGARVGMGVIGISK